jgi:hypothetical protein
MLWQSRSVSPHVRSHYSPDTKGAPWLAPLLLQGVGSDIVDGDAGDVDEDSQDSAEGAGGPGLASNPGLCR